MGLLRDQIDKWNYGQPEKNGNTQNESSPNHENQSGHSSEGLIKASTHNTGKKMLPGYYSAKVKLHRNHVW